jgi:peptide/nickel transport system substrate-binding protein
VLLVIGTFFIQIASAQNDSGTAPQPSDFKITTEHAAYYYTYEQEKNEKIRILVKIPEIIPDEKVVIKSVYTRGPHTFTDTYAICSDIVSTNCFIKLEEEEGVYFVDSDRQYGTLFGQWILDATYAGKRAGVYFEITSLHPFEIDAAKQEYTIRELKDQGLELVFLGSRVSNQTTLNLKIFKINNQEQELVLNRNINVTVQSQPPYFNRLPITFPNVVPFSIGQYNITATWGELFYSDTFKIVEPTLVINGEIENKDEVKNNGGCLIATAAFGSELAPQVQILREFRDSKVLSTISGTRFLQVFNALYYSFSPTIADIEKQNQLLQIIIRNSLYPLIGILQISQIPTVLGGETGIILTGFIASTLIGTVYMWPISIRFNLSRFFKQIVLTIITSVGLISYSTVFTNNTLLMVSTVVFVLASLALGITLTSKVLSIIRSKNKKRAN